jgi:hypothetical protein
MLSKAVAQRTLSKLAGCFFSLYCPASFRRNWLNSCGVFIQDAVELRIASGKFDWLAVDGVFRETAKYNSCRIHKSLRVTPAMEAGITDHVWDLGELIR